MNKILTAIILCSGLNYFVHAQFGARVLKDEQPRESFVKLVYHSMNDSIVSGYGFPNPTSIKYIVFSKEQPKEEITKNWENIKVKYAEFYYNKLAMQTKSVYKIKYSEEKSFLRDTLRVYYLKGKGGGSANGLEALSYENECVRFFEPIRWEGFNVYAKPVYVQTKELEPMNSKTHFLNYNNSSAFKRSSKRVFKGCKKLLQNINEGSYFPKSRNNLKQLADDYETLCLKN
ncbi:hypothetical protein [Winogradskyella poriferorum]|uniref:hypothetical protein n=1 Tax=Winogradskyella poriferorum TaxID=307627 RepID=UPI003D64C8CD